MKRINVFVCYAREDERWRKHLLSHLGVIAHENLVDVWDDTRITAGDDRPQGIDALVSQAFIAVLLISSHFLTSELIRERQISTLLTRNEREGMVLYPILLRSCAWEEVPWLARLQLRPGHGKPLAHLRTAGRDRALADVAKEIAAIARAAGAGVIESTQPDVHPATSDGEGAILKYTETVEYEREVTIAAARRIVSAMARFNGKMHDINARLRSMTEDELAGLTPAERHAFVEEATLNMHTFARALNANLPTFANSVDEGLGAMRSISELQEGSDITTNELADSAAVLLEYRGSFSAAADSITEFLDSFSLLPSMSIDFDAAGTEVASLLHRFVVKLADGRRVLAAALANTTALLARKS